MNLASGQPISISLRRLLIGACALSFCIFAENSAMAAAKSPACSVEPVDARGGTFTFSWEQVLQGDAFISLRNNGGKSQSVTVGLAGVPKSKLGPPLAALSIEPDAGVTKDKHGKFSVPQHGALLFNLKEAGTAPSFVPPSGSYATQLLLGSPCDAPPSKPTSITITVGKVQPAIAKLALMVSRPNPWTKSWTTNVDAPVKPGTALPDLSSGSRAVGILQRDSGGLATVTWTATKDDGNQKYPEATLSVADLSGAGSYSGSIVLADEKQGYDGKPSAPLDLTILVKDDWWWPAGMIFVSVLIAFLVKRYLGVQRLVWNMGLEEASLGKEYQEAQRKFIAATTGQPYGEYSILEDFGKQRQKVLDLIAKVEQAWGITSIDDNRDYKNASALLLALHHQLTAWGDLGDELSRLAEALHAVQDGGQHWNAPEIDAAEALLTRQTINLERIDALSTEVLQATQNLNGLMLAQTDAVGRNLVKTIFGLGFRTARPHSKRSPKVSDEGRVAFFSRAIREGDIAIAVFALLIAELIGLNTKYLGFKAFGTVKDYVDLFVWGAGTKATIDIVTVLLDKVSSSFYRQQPRA
jgi:hypothetical protein